MTWYFPPKLQSSQSCYTSVSTLDHPRPEKKAILNTGRESMWKREHSERQHSNDCRVTIDLGDNTSLFLAPALKSLATIGYNCFFFLIHWLQKEQGQDKRCNTTQGRVNMLTFKCWLTKCAFKYHRCILCLKQLIKFIGSATSEKCQAHILYLPSTFKTPYAC